MALFNVGMLISHLRRAKNMTQERLAEGICSRSTIARIENGERKPDLFTFRNIMMRLEQDPELYFSEYADKDEIYVYEKFKKCDAYVTAFRHRELKEELDALEKEPLFAPPGSGSDSGKPKSLGYLVLLRLKSSLHAQGEYKDLELALKCAMECLRHYRPDFDIELVSHYYLSHDENLMVNNIAIIYRELKGLPAALDIWLRLKENHDRDYVFVKNDIAYTNLVMNIAIALKLLGRYGECLEIAEEGYNDSMARHDMRSFSRFLYQRAFCLMKLGRKEEGLGLYKKFLMFAYVLDGYANISYETVRKEFVDTFGEDVPEVRL